MGAKKYLEENVWREVAIDYFLARHMDMEGVHLRWFHFLACQPPCGNREQ